MKKVMILIVFILATTGCSTISKVNRLIGNTPLSNRGSIEAVADNIMKDGKVIDIDISARSFQNGQKFTVENWIVEDKFGQRHMIELENGKIIRISPVEKNKIKTNFNPITVE